MIRLFHSIIGILLAVALETAAGNFGLTLPLTLCVVYRVTEKISLGAAFIIAFICGSFLDLLYWHDYPATGFLMSISLLLVRLLSRKMTKREVLFNNFRIGLLLGMFFIGGAALESRLVNGSFGSFRATAVVGIAAAVILQISLADRSAVVPVPRKEPETEDEKKVPVKRKSHRQPRKGNGGSGKEKGKG